MLGRCRVRTGGGTEETVRTGHRFVATDVLELDGHVNVRRVVRIVDDIAAGSGGRVQMVMMLEVFDRRSVDRLQMLERLQQLLPMHNLLLMMMEMMRLRLLLLHVQQRHGGVRRMRVHAAVVMMKGTGSGRIDHRRSGRRRRRHRRRHSRRHDRGDAGGCVQLRSGRRRCLLNAYVGRLALDVRFERALLHVHGFLVFLSQVLFVEVNHRTAAGRCRCSCRCR